MLEIGDFRNSEKYGKLKISLPIYPKLKKQEIDKICKEIERTYNIKILFKDISKKKISISGIIDLYPNNLKSVISSISLLADLEFKLKGDAYIVL